MKNPVTSILGIIQLLISLIAAIFPTLFGFDWASVDFQGALIAAFTMIANGIFGFVNIFKAADKGGGL